MPGPSPVRWSPDLGEGLRSSRPQAGMPSRHPQVGRGTVQRRCVPAQAEGMQTIVRGGPRDLIALAWYRIGFRPRESLVLVGLRGPKRRSGLVVRVDLPQREHRTAVIGNAVQLLRRSGDREVVALVVSDADGGPHAGCGGEALMPHREFARWLRHELPRRGIEVFDVLAVGPDSFRTYLCQDIVCCPPEGHSLDEVSDSELAAHMVLDGRSVLGCEADLVADVQPVPGKILSRRRLARVRAPDPETVLRDWRELLGAGAVEPPEPARLLVAMRNVRLRDAVMFTLIPGSGLIPERVLAGDVLRVEDQLWGNRPDDELVERGRRLLAALARVAPPGERAEALAVLAWLAWWCNNAARCRLLSDLALADRPEHRLAQLVAQLLAAGIPPTWSPSWTRT